MGIEAKTSRRGFLAKAGALGCSLAASPLVTPISFAATPGDHRLVVIILRGGMDGLDLVRPVGDPLFSTLRPELSKGNIHSLNNFFALHPNATALHKLWTQGELAFANAVSTPYRNKRSHFDGQDILEAGIDMDGRIKDGWLNRLVQTMPSSRVKTALAVGNEDLLILNGDADIASWSPAVNLSLSPATQDLLGLVFANDPTFSPSLHEAINLAERAQGFAGISEEDSMNMNAIQAMTPPKTPDNVDAAAQFAARMLTEDARIASFSVNGWDTHVRQQQNFAKALGKLERAIMTLKTELGQTWQKTTVLAMTEFGRTARQNGSKGTDHGTGGTIVMAGGTLKGGQIYGDWPGLEEADLYQRRDLMPTADIRLYAAAAMRGLFGVSNSALERTIFPDLDLSPGLPDFLL